MANSERSVIGWLIVCAACALASGCASNDKADRPERGRVQAYSLLGRPLVAPPPPASARARLEADLAAAIGAYEADPSNEDNAIWLGRRLAYLGRYDEAAAAFTDALRSRPWSYRLLRHRGHRYITLRMLDEAEADLTLADSLSAEARDEIEPDGAPNPLGVPRTTTRYNILYHLGLAQYLKGDFDRADEAFTRCAEVGRRNDDSLVAATHWLYLSRVRAGRHAEARAALERITPEMSVIENDAYHRLLLLHKGVLTPRDVAPRADDATVASVTALHGVGAYWLIRGETERAMSAFRRIVALEETWPAFGHIAAEAELARAGRE